MTPFYALLHYALAPMYLVGKLYQNAPNETAWLVAMLIAEAVWVWLHWLGLGWVLRRLENKFKRTDIDKVVDEPVTHTIEGITEKDIIETYNKIDKKPNYRREAPYNVDESEV